LWKYIFRYAYYQQLREAVPRLYLAQKDVRSVNPKLLQDLWVPPYVGACMGAKGFKRMCWRRQAEEAHNQTRLRLCDGIRLCWGRKTPLACSNRQMVSLSCTPGLKTLSAMCGGLRHLPFPTRISTTTQICSFRCMARNTADCGVPTSETGTCTL